MRTISLICILLMGFFTNILNAQEAEIFPLKVERLSDRAIVISAQCGFGTQLVLSTEKGLVVFGTHWSPTIAQEYKEVAEKEFNGQHVAYVILHRNRAFFTAGTNVYKNALVIAQERNRQRLIAESNNPEEIIKRETDNWSYRARMFSEEMADPNYQFREIENIPGWVAWSKSIVSEFPKGDFDVRPDITFSERFSLDLGNVTVSLFHCGSGNLIVQIPEEGILILTPFEIVHAGFSPGTKNIPEIMEILNELVKTSDSTRYVFPILRGVWHKDDFTRRVNYLNMLWQDIKAARADGIDMQAAKGKFSIDTGYSFLKQWDNYSEQGEEWIRFDHNLNFMVFWKQFQKSAAETIGSVINESGIEAALDTFKSIRTESPDSCYFDEGEFNSLGYGLMRQGKLKEAIEVFRMNVKIFAGSANAYDSLGEAYMNNGDKELAITNYQKSLELNPGNDNAKQMLERLKNQM